MIDIPASALGRLQDLPVTAGLSVTLLPQLGGVPSDRRSLAVELEDSQFVDVFTIFCTDLLHGLSGCTKVNDAIVLLLRRLARWQEFLGRASTGLSHREVIGLFGELWVLREVLIPAAGIGLLEAWTGVQRAPQDFIVPGVCAVEVKTSAASVLSSVRIHGERQLDDTGLSRLFLACLRVERPPKTGESLNDLVASLRSRAAGTPEFADHFDVLLAKAGWMPRHEQLYDAPLFRVAQQRYFRVDENFPRLTGRELPSGVTEIDYLLDLRDCDASECSKDEVISVLAELNLQINHQQ